MKKTIIRFKEPISYTKYEVYYKEIPKILTRYYYRKLGKKGCWDIETIDPEDLWKKFKTRSYSSEDIDNHVPRID